MAEPRNEIRKGGVGHNEVDPDLVITGTPEAPVISRRNAEDADMENGESDVAQILKITPSAEPVPAVRTKVPSWSRRECYHDNGIVDAEKRILTCANPNCEAVLDPIDFLIRWANRKVTADGMAKKRAELQALEIVHAAGANRHTVCGVTSDKRGYEVRITNKIHNVKCQSCRKALAKQGVKLGNWASGEPLTFPADLTAEDTL